MYRRPYLLIMDDTLPAQCLQRLLESEFPKVDIVTEGQGLLDAAAKSKPDLVLLDTRMPELDGLEVMHRLRDVSPMTRVIVLTMDEQPQYVAAALRAGSSGYLLKSCAVSELVTAIREVLKGQSYVTPSLGARTTSALTNLKSRPNAKNLTSRQREVLALVAQGRTAKEIAKTLGLSVKTAVFHKMSLMDRLGLRTTADLTKYALEHGILSSAGNAERPSSSTSGRFVSNSHPGKVPGDGPLIG